MAVYVQKVWNNVPYVVPEGVAVEFSKNRTILWVVNARGHRMSLFRVSQGAKYWVQGIGSKRAPQVHSLKSWAGLVKQTLHSSLIAEVFPKGNVTVGCPLCGELRRYRPFEVFLGFPDSLIQVQQGTITHGFPQPLNSSAMSCPISTW